MTRLLSRLALAIAFLAACEDGPDPVTGAAPISEMASVAESGLNFLRLQLDAPPLTRTIASFYAVKGQDRQVQIYYRRRPGALEATRIARFRVRKESLIKDAHGRLLKLGDSVQITMKVVDPDRQLIELTPSGLTFSKEVPAQLTLWYLETNPDFNGDGRVNTLDSQLESTLKVWGQEVVGGPFLALPTMQGKSGDECETDIPGFTRYVVAY